MVVVVFMTTLLLFTRQPKLLSGLGRLGIEREREEGFLNELPFPFVLCIPQVRDIHQTNWFMQAVYVHVPL